MATSGLFTRGATLKFLLSVLRLLTNHRSCPPTSFRTIQISDAGRPHILGYGQREDYPLASGLLVGDVTRELRNQYGFRLQEVQMRKRQKLLVTIPSYANFLGVRFIKDFHGPDFGGDGSHFTRHVHR